MNEWMSEPGRMVGLFSFTFHGVSGVLQKGYG